MAAFDAAIASSFADPMTMPKRSNVFEQPIPLPAYEPAQGMALSIFHNKYSRRKTDGSMQSYAERVGEVIDGNFLLDPRWAAAEQTKEWATPSAFYLEYLRTRELAIAGVIPTSGRHLQHGDLDQPNKIMELHTNCSTALFSFMLFRLLLRGSGVGRDYSSECCRINWDFMPNVRLVLDASHPDFSPNEFNGFFDSRADALHKYDSESETVRWFDVEDSREGWSKCVEILETAAWQEKHSHKLFIFDFSQVRAAGQPIKGLQGRPSSGPLGLMRALAKVASIKGTGMKPWKQALFIDHYLAACVQLGGARRSARMSVKNWRDRDVIEFIDIKRGGYLWSSNNSVLVDEEFWLHASSPRPSHGRRVFEAVTASSYFDSTGEPGYINVDKLNNNRTGMEKINKDNYINTKVYTDLHPRTMDMIENVLAHVMKLKHPFLTNPCGEIVLSTYGGYCLIGDVCLAHAASKQDAMEAVGLLAKFLVRVNLMRSDYAAEVQRTNRIGVCLTGIHEFAYKLFGLTFYEMLAYYDTVFGNNNYAKANMSEEKFAKVEGFWQFINNLRQTAEIAADKISLDLGITPPHTITAIKPSGTISKVMGCTEGVHLPPMVFYLRWVQYHVSDADLINLQNRGYPIKDISAKYPDHMVVGFPTKQPIVDLMGAEKVVTADQVSTEDNFKWLRLLEHFWLGQDRGNQISYTLKYDQEKISYTEFMDMILEHQPTVKVCSVMPQSDWQKSEKIYGYVPEQPISENEFNFYMQGIDQVAREGYDDQTLACEGGACPIEFDVPANVASNSLDNV